MGDELVSAPREELLVLLGFERPRKKRKPEREPKPMNPALKRKKEPKPKKEPVYRGRPLPDLSTVPPARGNPMLNQTGHAAARRAYEEKQAAKAGRVREPKATPGRAVPNRRSGEMRAIYETQDAE